MPEIASPNSNTNRHGTYGLVKNSQHRIPGGIRWPTNQPSLFTQHMNKSPPSAKEELSSIRQTLLQ
jgi:hypothetical protein